MNQAFSFNREYDYIRLDGLSRVTGRPPHEWDIYITKELIDNALDADEFLWYGDHRQFPSVDIMMKYISLPPPRNQQLFVSVRNRASFPVRQIQDIFLPQWYTSRKAFIKGLTRGSLGNALKTLLGIPYVLRNRVVDDWKPDLKPLSICCNGREYIPQYVIDSIRRTIRFRCETLLCKSIEGTIISTGLDYFVQEIPRTMAEIETLAQQYHLCNPHAEFRWTVEIGDQVWKKEYQAQSDWTNKFRDVSPVQWYSLTDFKYLLGALYREHCNKEREEKLQVRTLCKYFAGFNNSIENTDQYELRISRIIQDIRRNGLAESDINSPLANTLYAALTKHSPVLQIV